MQEPRCLSKSLVRFLPFVSGSFLLLLVLGSAFGQIIPVGSIDGTVFDPTQAAVPTVRISLTNLETGLKRETESDSQGHYFLPQLPP